MELGPKSHTIYGFWNHNSILAVELGFSGGGMHGPFGFRISSERHGKMEMVVVVHDDHGQTLRATQKVAKHFRTAPATWAAASGGLRISQQSLRKLEYQDGLKDAIILW